MNAAFSLVVCMWFGFMHDSVSCCRSYLFLQCFMNDWHFCVGLGGWMKWDAVLTEIVVVCRGMSSLCVWWITMVMSHKHKKQRSLESILKCEFYWINKLYIFCSDRPCSLTDILRSWDVTLVSLTAVKSKNEGTLSLSVMLYEGGVLERSGLS